MKKILLLLSLFCLSTFIFAENVTINPIKTSYNDLYTDSTGALVQRVYSDDGMEINIGAKLDKDRVVYSVNIRNISNPNLLVQQNIKTFYGNFDNNSWTENTAESYSSNASSDNNAKLDAVDTCLLMGAGCLCALTIFEICESNRSSSKTTYTKSKNGSRSSKTTSRSTRRSTTVHAPDIPIFFFFGNDSGNSSRSYSDNNSSNSYSMNQFVRTGESYSGTFSVPASRGPDYKLRFIVSNDEYIDFYFSRSDRASIVNPWKDHPKGRHSLVASTGAPDLFQTWGGYYIYSGESIGAYFGLNMNITPAPSGFEFGTVPTVLDTDLTSTFTLNSRVDNKLAVNDMPNFVQTDLLRDLINFTAGITIKTFSNTWLMLGCGVDLNVYTSCGTITYSDSSVDRGWFSVEQPDVYVVPEVGINFIFNFIDIGATVQYVIDDTPEDNFRGNIMIGIAF